MWSGVCCKNVFCDEEKGFRGCRNTQFSFVRKGQRHKRPADWSLGAFVSSLVRQGPSATGSMEALVR